MGEIANIPMPETAVVLTYDPKAPGRDGLLAGVQLSGLAVPGRPTSGNIYFISETRRYEKIIWESKSETSLSLIQATETGQIHEMCTR